MPKMKTVIVIPDGELLPGGVVSSYFLLSQANQYLLSAGRAPAFDLIIAGKSSLSWVYHGHFGIKATPIDLVDQDIDLIIVPGFISEEIPVKRNDWLIRWMKHQYTSHQTELASMCTGAFLLAATGALDGKKATTHWAFKQQFCALFPKVELVPDKIVTDDTGTYTGGGAFSSLNLLFYLIEKFAGKEVCVYLSKIYQIDLHRNSQRPFMIVNQLYDHEDEAIKQFQMYVEQHYEDQIVISILARKFAFSARTLVRRFKKATGITPLQYLQQIRMEAAKRFLENSNLNISEIIYKIGYKDGPTFRKIFKRHTGFSPQVYRNKYRLDIW